MRTVGSRSGVRVAASPADGGAAWAVEVPGSGPTRAAMARNDAASSSSTGGVPTRPTSRPPAAGPTSTLTWSPMLSRSWPARGRRLRPAGVGPRARRHRWRGRGRRRPASGRRRGAGSAVRASAASGWTRSARRGAGCRRPGHGFGAVRTAGWCSGTAPATRARSGAACTRGPTAAPAAASPRSAATAPAARPPARIQADPAMPDPHQPAPDGLFRLRRFSHASSRSGHAAASAWPGRAALSFSGETLAYMLARLAVATHRRGRDGRVHGRPPGNGRHHP